MSLTAVQGSVDDAFDHCARLADAHYENFPVASLLLPEEKRPYLQAVYAFSRIADDFADEGDRPTDERLADLDDWEEQLQRCYRGEAEHPVFIALRETVSRIDLPLQLFLDLLEAFRRDVMQHRYETFDELLDYCRCSANPVGRIVLRIFGHRDEALFPLSDNVCTALQLTNFWQDVAVDREKDRLYIPLDDMEIHGYDLGRWKAGLADESFGRLMAFEVSRTRQMFLRGSELPSRVERELQLELKLVWLGGMRILKKLEGIGYDVFRGRPSLTLLDKLTILSRGLFVSDLTRSGRRKS